MAKFLFEETRYCFAYGQYLAVIVLGVAFIERTLAAEFYASGRNDLRTHQHFGAAQRSAKCWLVDCRGVRRI